MKALNYLFVALAIVGCTSRKPQESAVSNDTIVIAQVEETSSPATIGEIPLPDGYERVVIEDTTSFAYYLRNLPLKPLGTPVYTCHGDVANTNNAAYAVIDGIDTGTEDLQQCADAIIRLRAEWLYKNKRYDEIAFHFTNGWLCEYKRWAEGERVAINGNKTSWYKATGADYSYETFRKYLRTVFYYAGTLSLSRELKPVNITDINIGDVFIHGGSPGHAIIVLDVAQNNVKGDKCFLVAESYMPAQDIHVIINCNDTRDKETPWHSLDALIRSGEEYNFTTWIFTYNELKRF